MYIPTMTLCELVERLRSLGVPTSNTKAAAMIEAGQYPFASCVRLKEDGERVFEISKVLFDKWVAERVVLQPGDPGYQVPLELCPTSNLQTKAVPDLAHFPLKKYLAQGVAATVNTDNMTVSRTTLAQEFASLRLSPQERRAVLLHSVEAAFLPPAQKAALRQAVEAALAH